MTAFLPLVNYIKGRNNLMFIGEAGSGKSELAIQAALALASESQTVHIFDMDQTKPLFRLRDAKDILKNAGVILHSANQFLDAPVMVGGVLSSLKNQAEYTILDVGGGDYGAKMMGGFAPFFAGDKGKVFYVINPYRAFSDNMLSIDATMSYILRSARIKSVHIVANPYLGRNMTLEEFINGLEKVEEMLDEHLPIEMVCVPDFLYEEARIRTKLPLMMICRNIVYPWEEERVKGEVSNAKS